MIAEIKPDVKSTETFLPIPKVSGTLEPHLETSQRITRQFSTLRKELIAIREELQKIQAIQSPLVGIEQVAQYFGKSQDTIRRWVKDRVISCYKIPNSKGNVLLFSFKQIENDLADYLQERL